MSQVNARLVYRNAYNAMVAAGVDPKKAVLSQSYLRLEVAASTSKTNYQFGVLINDQPQGNPIRPTETRLNLQDAFFVASVQLFTAVAASATATNFALTTYPNPRIFSTAGAAAALYNLYNGYLSLTVNNSVITPSWDLYRHLEINQTQQTTTPVAAGIPLDQTSGLTSTAVACEPNWVLIGSKNNVLQLNLPAAIDTLQAASTTVLVIILRGVLAQNCTVVS
jgi:hypothetical protein